MSRQGMGRHRGATLAAMRQLPDPLSRGLDNLSALGRESFNRVLNGTALADRALVVLR
jgi:hypothetical protein